MRFVPIENNRGSTTDCSDNHEAMANRSDRGWHSPIEPRHSECVYRSRRQPANPIGTAAKNRNQNPNVRVQSLPSNRHESSAWHTGASMYGSCSRTSSFAPRIARHARSPSAVALASFAAIDLRRDSHPQECAHAGRTESKGRHSYGALFCIQRQ